MVEHETNLKISLILMSAGTSQRMKECKQLMKLPNSDILAENDINQDIPIAFWLCISTIVAILIQGIVI